MGILFWVIFGGLVGWIASIATRTDEEQGMLGNIAVGIIGALIGGFIADRLGWSGVTGFNLPSFVTALAGAIILSMAVRMFRSSSH